MALLMILVTLSRAWTSKIKANVKWFNTSLQDEFFFSTICNIGFKVNSLSVTLSAKTKPRIPATSCSMKITVKLMQNCDEEGKKGWNRCGWCRSCPHWALLGAQPHQGAWLVCWMNGGGGLFGRLLTHRLEEADVFSQRAHAATEGDDEHENPHDQQDNSRVHWQTGQSRLWKRFIGSFMHLNTLILHRFQQNRRNKSIHGTLSSPFTCLFHHAGIHTDGHHHHGDYLKKKGRDNLCNHQKKSLN